MYYPVSTHHRPSWDDYFIEMARLAAARGTCPRRRVGSVLVRDNRLIATGYNGAVRGAPHCDDEGCLMVDGHCVRAVHSELNALLQCAAHGLSSMGSTLYCTDFPCVHCAKAVVQAGVRVVVFLADYPDPHSAEILRAGGVELFCARRGADRYYLSRHGEETATDHGGEGGSPTR